MIAIGWMVVTVVVTAMVCVTVSPFFVRPSAPNVDSDGGLSARIRRLEGRSSELADMPPAEAIIGRLTALESSPTNAKQVVNTLNAHTTDLLDLKTVVAELRTEVGKVRTRQSLGALGG